MKHTGSYIIAAIWIVIALLLCGVLVRGMTGSDFGWKLFSFRGLFDGDFSPVATECIETNYSEDSVKAVMVDVVASSVSMTVGSSSRIEVKITTNLPEDRRPVAKMDGDTLSIRTPPNMKTGINFTPFKTEVEIKVPSSFNTSKLADKRNISIDTVSGSINVENIKAKSFDVDSVSGSIRLTDVTTKSIEADSISGSIKFADVTTDSLNADSTSGSINVSGSIGSFDLDSTSGSVRIETDVMPSSTCSVETVSGSVSVSLPENSGFTLDYSSVSGTTENKFTGFRSDHKSRSGKDKYKDGDVKIAVETISGSIHIEKR